MIGVWVGFREREMKGREGGREGGSTLKTCGNPSRSLV